ncbi:MAG: bifunctional diaminohydroxyphosphoribosylaminopyrimidine deaminase/5-amino-6-(5-phosphoribosylamino)uracil reductase RibD [Candidatus Caldatribacteriota bacterium]|nr:bifunctional diaminohydroxyphosphoribosylaminopyrimidine deaminase/5-amino-6-(5-phosphoribosylamino)uracil reductase RibD [Candidatus Caldatribacteriota bacterium]
MDKDIFFMQRVLRLAKKGMGTTSPNPMVGSILVKNGEIIGEGFHRKAGEAHAEIIALKIAGERARGADLYVTLEPCSHYGKTPPCVEAVIKSGVKRAVIAMQDPNPLVAGRGIKRLKEAGIEVIVGVMEEEAKKLNEVFIKYITTKRPFVIGKIAQSLDGKIALSTGESKWITSEPAREKVHELRNWYDAVMVGIGTVLSDDPLLTCRLPGKRKTQTRIIVDSTAKIPLNARIFKHTEGRVIVATTDMADKKKIKTLRSKELDLIETNAKDGKVNLIQLLDILGNMGITSVLVEGGSRLLTSLIRENLIDKLIIFLAPMFLGGPGLNSVGDLFIAGLKKAPRFKFQYIKQVGNDLMLEVYFVD